MLHMSIFDVQSSFNKIRSLKERFSLLKQKRVHDQLELSLQSNTSQTNMPRQHCRCSLVQTFTKDIQNPTLPDPYHQ